MLLKRAERVAELMSEAGLSVAGVAVVALSGLVAYCAVSRYFFSRPVYFTEEGSGILLMMGLSLAFGYCFVKRKHVRLTVIVDRLPPKVKGGVELVAHLVLLCYLLIFADLAISYTISAFQLGMRTDTAHIYLPPFLVVFCLSLLIFIIAVLASVLAKGIRALSLGRGSQ